MGEDLDDLVGLITADAKAQAACADVFSVIEPLRCVCARGLLTERVKDLVRAWRAREEFLFEYDGGPHVSHRDDIRNEIDAIIRRRS